MCRALLRGLANELVFRWTGSAHRPSWRRHRQARAAVVLTGHASMSPHMGRAGAAAGP